jgi:hypothetical protein
MFGFNYYELEAVRERQASILEERRKANSTKSRLSFHDLFLIFYV